MAKKEPKPSRAHVPGVAREWITIPVAGKSKEQWQVDVTYLSSNYRCLFGDGCCGVLTEPAPELVQGCCSYGAHANSDADKRHVEKMAKQLTPEEWQHLDEGRKRGVWKRSGKDEWITRLVDDACVFLNRPGFEGGPGCALHVLAQRLGVHFSETKPTVCWQLPLREVDRDEEDGSVTHVLTEFARHGWGEGGDEFAWWCTEAPEAFTGSEAVYRSLEPELRKMVGDVVFDALAEYLGARIAAGAPAAPVTHPAQVAVSLGQTRTRQHPVHG
jgi:hypothetical protein